MLCALSWLSARPPVDFLSASDAKYFVQVLQTVRQNEKRNQSRALNRALSEFSVSEAQIMSFGACEALLNTDSKRMPIFPTLFPFACFRLFSSGQQSSYKCRTTWMNLMGVIVFKWLLSSFVGLVSSACIQELLLVSPPLSSLTGHKFVSVCVCLCVLGSNKLLLYAICGTKRKTRAFRIESSGCSGEAHSSHSWHRFSLCYSFSFRCCGCLSLSYWQAR